MSTTSKSRIVLFLMVVIALVFFITSFLAATFSNGVNTTVSNSQQPNANISCIEVRAAEERILGECS